MNNVYLWLIILLLFLIIEAATVSLVTIWFAAGALAATIAAYVDASFLVQLLIFCGVSAILLLSLRPYVRKHMPKKVVRTNAESLIGKTALITQTVDNLNQTGQVRIGDVEWTARAAQDGVVIPEGKIAEIVEIQGVKLLVKEI